MAVVAAFCLAGIAIHSGEHINSLWLVLASSCTYLIGFRFCARFIAARVMALDDSRATPAERLRNGHDFEPANKWILFGHHFAASSAGPIGSAPARLMPFQCLRNTLHRNGLLERLRGRKPGNRCHLQADSQNLFQ